MKRKILSLLVLLLMAVTGAWADNDLYLKSDDGFTTATLMWDEKKGVNPYYNGSEWNGLGDNRYNITSITVDTSCTSFDGTSLLYLFFEFSKLTTINNIGNLNTSNVTNMYGVFHTCGALTTLDLRNWDTAKVTSMESMFHSCAKLTAIYVGNNWSTGDHVTSSDNMFYYCSNLPNYNNSEIDKTHANTGADGYLNKVKVTANLANGAYWGTFYSNVGNHLAPEGTQVFAVNLTDATITMTEIGDRIVRSDEGVVLKQVTESSEPTTTIIMTLTGTEPTGNFTTNSLQGTMTEITNPGNAYVLNYKETTGVGFYKLAAYNESTGVGTIGANKAYLTYSGSLARGFFGLDETTDVNEVRVKMEDERGEYYDLQGRRVAQPTKGLYIMNGKKVFIK